MLLQRHMRNAWHRSLGEPEVTDVHDPATEQGLAEAQARARELQGQGRLVNSIEAMAAAGRDHSLETLYSVARDSAFRNQGDLPTILRRLERDWPAYA